MANYHMTIHDSGGHNREGAASTSHPYFRSNELSDSRNKYGVGDILEG